MFVKRLVNAVVWNNRSWKENKQLVEENKRLWADNQKYFDRYCKEVDNCDAAMEMYNEVAGKRDRLEMDLERYIELLENIGKHPDVVDELKKIVKIKTNVHIDKNLLSQ